MLAQQAWVAFWKRTRGLLAALLFFGLGAGSGYVLGARQYRLPVRVRESPFLRRLWGRLSPANTAAEARYTVLDPFHREMDLSPFLRVRAAADLPRLRAALRRAIWGEHRPPRVAVEDIVLGVTIPGLQGLPALRTDVVQVRQQYGLDARVYHFHPRQPNGGVVLYYCGHGQDLIQARGILNAFLSAGYAVVGFYMPLEGPNAAPVVILDGIGPMRLRSHDQMVYLDHPIRFFLDPVLAMIAYLEAKRPSRDLAMLGLSGGGWATTLCAALEPRIRRSYPVAGTLPLALREADWGDYEQTTPEVYRVADYPDLYLLGAAGAGRGQLQVLNQYDPSCFWGLRHQVYEGLVQRVLRRLGPGRFTVLHDAGHRRHMLSPAAMRRVLADLQGAPN